MANLKISQFVDGDSVQVTDEIATNRGGVNTKVKVGSAAIYNVGMSPYDIPLNFTIPTTIANTLSGTSSTENTIGAGSLTFETEAGKSFEVGRWVLIVDAGNSSSNYMSGVVTSYDQSTGDLEVDIQVFSGSGTIDDWLVYVSGTSGQNGSDGDNGWSPVLAVVANGDERVFQIYDWVGGEGIKPSTGGYIGPTGIVSDINDAVDIRGARGPAGEGGSASDVDFDDAGLIHISGSNVQSAINSIDPIISNLLVRNFIDGYTLSTAGASTTMTISDGQVADSTNALYLNLESSIAKTTSAWAVGTAQGGLDTGSIANNTWYRFYAIRRPDTGVVDVVFSTNGSAPTLPANYTQYAPLWWGRTDGSGQWIETIQSGNRFYFASTILDIEVNNPGISGVARTLTVPPKEHILALAKGYAMDVTTAGNATLSILLSSLLVDDEAPTPYNSTAPNQDAVFPGVSTEYRATITAQEKPILTNGSSQIRSRLGNSTTNVFMYIRTVGWIDERI